MQAEMTRVMQDPMILSLDGVASAVMPSAGHTGTSQHTTSQPAAAATTSTAAAAAPPPATSAEVGEGAAASTFALEHADTVGPGLVGPGLVGPGLVDEPVHVGRLLPSWTHSAFYESDMAAQREELNGTEVDEKVRGG